ncbi:MAG: hypothetical protein ACLP1D_10600, partial [Xanthobacteraceae bacterium]
NGRIGWDFPGSHDLNFSNRPVRTRMPGGVAGVRPKRSPPMPIATANAAAQQHEAVPRRAPADPITPAVIFRFTDLLPNLPKTAALKPALPNLRIALFVPGTIGVKGVKKACGSRE